MRAFLAPLIAPQNTLRNLCKAAGQINVITCSRSLEQPLGYFDLLMLSVHLSLGCRCFLLFFVQTLLLSTELARSFSQSFIPFLRQLLLSKLVLVLQSSLLFLSAECLICNGHPAQESFPCYVRTVALIRENRLLFYAKTAGM